MTRELEVGTARAAPGRRADGRIEVSRRPGGGDLSIPVVVVNGVEDGPVLWIDGAIHGDEPEGPLSIQMLLQRVDPERLRGALVCVPVVNVAAFEAQQRGDPADGFTYDMNRIYPGKPDGYPSERVAHAHHRAMIEVADLELSIHSGGAHSYLAQALFYGHAGPSLELAQAMGPGWDLFLRSMSTSGSPMAAMANAGRAALTVELGGLCSTLPEDFLANGTTLADAFENVMRHYGMLDGEARTRGAGRSVSSARCSAASAASSCPRRVSATARRCGRARNWRRFATCTDTCWKRSVRRPTVRCSGCGRCPAACRATGPASSARSRRP
jgi:uncharacterized protein